jgi:hopanoid-associated phosphorylase
VTTLLAVVGMRREAAIVAGPGVIVLVGGGVSETLARALSAKLDCGDIGGVISIGLAGALASRLAVGAAVVAEELWSAEERFQTDPAWARRLLSALPDAVGGRAAGSNAVVSDARAKAALGEASGAICVDMESHLAARAARAAGVPFAALRFISDGATRTLPHAAEKGLRPDGGVDVAAVALEALRRPYEIPALVRTGLEAEAAFRALLRSRRRLGPTLGFADV